MDYETKRIDHLGIVAGICQGIDLIEQVNSVAGASERKVSTGQAVQAMVLNALGFSSRALYLVPDYWKNKPVEILVGEELKAEDLNDDSLGRSLDDLYEAGVTEVFAAVASHALRVEGIKHRFLHLDSSSFHVHGKYETGEEEQDEEDRQVIEITEGFSKDHRPDLKQAILTLITSEASNLPVWMEALSGNSNDRKSFPETVKAYNKQLAGSATPYYVMDSAGYSADNLKTMEKVLWLTRVPETLKDAQELVAGTKQEDMVKLEEGYWGKEVVKEYGGIQQRWLVIYSEAAFCREEKGLERKQAKELETTQKEWRKLMQEAYNCQADAEHAAAQFNQRLHYHQVKAEIIAQTKYTHAGRPGPDEKPEITGYRLQGEVVANPEALAKVRLRFGKFILATNQMDAKELSCAEMLSHYKDQGVSVERGFRFLKDPHFFAHSLFLKTPQRLMALMMVMVTALLVYALAERKLRLQLEQENCLVPSQTGKPTKTPTMRWIFQMFEGIDILLISQDGKIVARQVLNLRPVHLLVIRLLGKSVQNCYSLPP